MSFEPKLLEHQVTAIDGALVPLDRWHGQVLLIVNTASQCGFTPQYEGLQALQDRFGARGFSVLAFPCNQFGAQEPGDNGTIASFCEMRFHATFPLFAKVDVNGPDADPFWRALKQAQPGFLGSQAIKWNFTKFLVDRAGRAVARFAPATRPDTLAGRIATLLG
jgi:glutathione peroxidase